MAYKKLIKVSNVCQLLDKSKYPATQTKNGVTFTNNGDGTITANGTCTAEYYVAYVLNHHLKDKMVIGHKYALFAGNNLVTYYPAEVILMFYPRSDGKLFSAANVEHTDGQVGWVLPEGSYSSYSKVELRIRSGATVENFTFKPQLFDLTEMYGAGNEPTTVEQFRQDFPEEMYDYSPYCWLTSYKRVLVTGNETYPTLTAYRRNLTCKTKNLLNPKMCNIYQNIAFGLNIEYIDNNQTVHIYGTSAVTTGSASFNVIKTNDKSIYNKGYKIKFFNLAGKNPPVFKDIYGLREIDTAGQIAIMIEITKGVYYDFSFKIMVSEQTVTDYVPYGHL